jgi:type I restriction enzyme, R subunit
MNEAETRAEYIDPALKEAGWGVVEGSRIRREFPISKGRILGHGKKTAPLSADYVLNYRNRNLAVIEAKKRDLDYTDGVGQAKDYAQRLQVRFTYSTNGLKIYEMDMKEATEGDVSSFPTPQELWERTFGEENRNLPAKADWRDKFSSIPFEAIGGKWQPRYYQENAITNTLDAIAAGENRILLTLATGTGKTAIAFQIAWKLFKSKWNINIAGDRSPRILFLADRNILADQAFNSFSGFEEDALVRISPAEIKKKGKVPKNGHVFFTIFQTFMSGPNKTPYFGQYPKDFFDFIIIDECHRGGSKDESSWRAIMNYFSPAVQLGLTATPKRDKNVDTYNYFGDPVYIYSLKEGINDGFLTPFKVKQIDTTIDEYLYTEDDDVEEGEVEEGKVYTEDEFNTKIEIRDREEYKVKIFMKLVNQNNKSLVFCAKQTHAALIRNLINQISDSKNPNYCHRVTANDGKLGEQHLRDFQDNEKSIPTILTTSRKLSTGVDAPEVRNIVLLRPVKNMIEFKQIIGRGTRLFDGKDYFTIYDYVGAHRHFLDPEWDGEPLDPESCATCGEYPCICPPIEPPICQTCNQRPCICERIPEPCPECGNDPCVCDHPPRRMIRITLSDGKVRELQHMVQTSFWSADGRPISSAEFLQSLFGELPSLFTNEDELRLLWSRPDTRKKLMDELKDKGFAKSQLEDLKSMIHAEKSDLYDVLAYVAFNNQPIDRDVRADKAKIHFNSYSPNQQEFLDFVLQQYVNSGVDELDVSKLPDLLELKYKAIADAKSKLGDIASIRNTFIGFQEYLYERDAV